MGLALDVAIRFVTLSLHMAAYMGLLYYHPPPTSWCAKDFDMVDCMNEEGARLRKDNGTDLQIILPSYGQTGTTSVVMALREMGYRAFHADDYSVFSRTVMWDKDDPGLWSKGVTKCRMEAISLEPVTDILPIALKMSPHAKFIMTWRFFPNWRKSTMGSRKKELRWGVVHEAFQRANRLIPWIETFDWATGYLKHTRQEGNPFQATDRPISSYVYRTLCNGYSWPITNVEDRGTFKSKASEEAYLGHMNEIRMSVPKERLLEFDVSRHGWSELEEFLGVKTGKAGKRLPHPRSKNLRTNEVILEANFSVVGWALVVFAALHALNFFCLGMLVWLALFLLWGLACALGIFDWPLEGAEEHFDAALRQCPLIVVMDGVEEEKVVPLGKALAAAGVCVLAVPLSASQALEPLVKALPECAVGCSLPATRWSLYPVYEAKGHFVCSPFFSKTALRRARGMGLAALPSVSTPTEAARASRAGASALLLSAGDATPKLRAVRESLPADKRLLAWTRAEPAALADCWAAGANGIVVGSSLIIPGHPIVETTKHAKSLVAACQAARR